jgi:hypothetical protein
MPNKGLDPGILPNLKPGDLLIYSRKGLFGLGIKYKTWSKYTHVEVYKGDGLTHAARDGFNLKPPPSKGTGVGTYFISFDGLVKVRRPFLTPNLEEASKYEEEVKGQIYDWMGIFRFFTLGKQSQDKQFCSETATRWERRAGTRPFAESQDADLASPRDLAFTPSFYDIYDLDTYPKEGI